MHKTLMTLGLLTAIATNANAEVKTMTYVVMPDGIIYCLMSRLQTCNNMKDTIIENKGVYKPDGVFRSITYDPFKKPEYKKCGMIYDPKSGTSKMYKC